MNVVRRGSAGLALTVLAVLGVLGAGPVTAALAQEADPAPYDPTISEQSATSTGTIDDGSCPADDPQICEIRVLDKAGGDPATLPRTGPADATLATAAVGTGLLLAGAAAVVAGRRRPADRRTTG